MTKDDQMMQPCRKGCGELVHIENDGFHVCRTSNSESIEPTISEVRAVRERPENAAAMLKRQGAEIEQLRAALERIAAAYGNEPASDCPYCHSQRKAREALGETVETVRNADRDAFETPANTCDSPALKTCIGYMGDTSASPYGPSDPPDETKSCDLCQGWVINASFNFCPKCGRKFEAACSVCGKAPHEFESWQGQPPHTYSPVRHQETGEKHE